MGQQACGKAGTYSSPPSRPQPGTGRLGSKQCLCPQQREAPQRPRQSPRTAPLPLPLTSGHTVNLPGHAWRLNTNPSRWHYPFPLKPAVAPGSSCRCCSSIWGLAEPQGHVISCECGLTGWDGTHAQQPSAGQQGLGALTRAGQTTGRSSLRFGPPQGPLFAGGPSPWRHGGEVGTWDSLSKASPKKPGIASGTFCASEKIAGQPSATGGDKIYPRVGRALCAFMEGAHWVHAGTPCPITG